MIVSKFLPVPPLSDTLKRLGSTVEPVVEAETAAEFPGVVDRFGASPGAQLQARLEAFAEEQARHGASYLSDAWTQSYLDTRTPLPLTTSVSFQLAGFPSAVGLERAADFLHRAATIHLRQRRGETPVEVDPRGTTLDMDQWEILSGGVRHPQAGRDEARRPSDSPSRACIGVLFHGRLFLAHVADDDGRILPSATIRDVVSGIIDRATDPESSPFEDAVPATVAGFTGLSYLGSEVAGPMLEELLGSPENAEVYAHLTDMLFVLHVLDDAEDSHGAVVQTEDGAPQGDVDRLRNLAFEPGHAWAYKPITYELSLTSDWLAIHFEHSAADGATVRAAVARMQELDLADEDSSPEQADVQEPRELVWSMTDDFRGRLEARVAEYREASAPYGVLSTFAPRTDLTRLGLRVSDDAVAQLLMTYAQLATYGRVRSVYESVDMREFQAGRTECLRPLTPQAVTFARALLEDSATLDQFRDVLDAHRDWVKACKRGAGVDRHLFGLRMMAEQAGEDLAFLESPGLQALGKDFLSTTSLGESQPINRYAFAPSLPHGLGIGYIKYDDGFEYVINHRADHAERVAEFAHNLVVAGQALCDWAAQFD